MKKSVFLLVTILLFAVQFVYADSTMGPCETVSQSGTRLELIDFGIAYSEDFKFNSQNDRLDLYGGVCIKRETGDTWQLEAESIVIENPSEELELSADSVSFQFDGWTLISENLISSTDFFEFENVDISKDAMTINATSLQLDLTTSKFTLTEVNAIYRNEFQISGMTMDITQQQVVFKDAYVTTCMCEEDHLYTVKSPNIVYDVNGNTLLLSQADLSFLNSTMPLGENYRIDTEIDLQFPTPFLDYSDDLELALNNIVLASGLSANIGAQGVDAEHEFNPYGVFKLNLTEATTPGLGGNLNGTLGQSVNGPLADLSYVTPLAKDLSLDFGTRNHSWTSAEYLHDAFVGLSYKTRPVHDPKESGTLDVTSRVFAAITRQEIESENVIGPRLGVSLSNRYVAGSPQEGLFRVRVVPEATYYPIDNSFQYVLTINPSLIFRSEGFSLNSTYTHVFTNSNSPFTTDADEASAASTLNMTLGFQENSSQGNSFGFSTSTSIDFLKDTSANQSLIRTVALNINSTIQGFENSQSEFKPYLAAELARVLTGIEDTSLDDGYYDDFVQLGMDSFFNDWEVGLRARLNPNQSEDEEFLEVLEMGLGLPLRQGEFLLKPYIGINFAHFLTDVETDSFAVSTYGISAEYDCCGDANAFFQMRDGQLTTGLKLPF